jgi:predicted permease
MLTDLHYAVRALRKSPGFTFVAMLTLALGIGANAAIFSAVNAVLLRPLPYRDAGALVTVDHFYPSLKGLEAGVSAPGFVDYRDRTRSFTSVAVEGNWQPNLTGQGDPERLTGARLSGQYFTTLGVRPALGRVFGPDEDQPGREHVVVLSDGVWRTRFGADPSIVGRTLTLDGEPHEVIGVMPAAFRDFFRPTAALWRPLALTPEQLTMGRTSEFLTLTARLKPGVTAQQAAVDVRTLAEQLKAQYPESYPTDWTLKVTPLRDKGTGKVRPALLMLFGAVAFVLLIACANVANLLLARAAGRAREVAVRAALGAQRSRLVRQLLTESVVLALAGGVLGLLFAQFGLRALGALTSTNLAGQPITMDWRVLVFALLLSMATGLIFGMAPALHLARAGLQATMREGGRAAAGDRGAQRLRRGLIVSEVALAVVLLTGAGLLIRSFQRLAGVSPGFEPSHVLTATIALPEAKYRTRPEQAAFFDALLPRLAAVPGIQAVGATSSVPLGPNGNTRSFTVEGYQPAPDQPAPWGDFRVVTPRLFEALRTPLRRGRTFTEQDGPTAPLVVIVDEELAHRYWANADPIGKRITYGAPRGDTIPWRTVVGVVGHVKYDALDTEARVQLYVPAAQAPTGVMALVVRTAGDPLAAVPLVREAVRSIDRDQPLSSVKTMDDLVDAAMGQRRSSMTLLSVFAGFALLIACIGLYGITAYAVTQRTREIGVRMALGAASTQVVRPFVRDSLGLAVAGLVIGSLVALGASRLLQSQLYQVPSHDPLTLLGTAGLLAGVAAVASYLPARRATQVSPIVALRSE